MRHGRRPSSSPLPLTSGAVGGPVTTTRPVTLPSRTTSFSSKTSTRSTSVPVEIHGERVAAVPPEPAGRLNRGRSDAQRQPGHRHPVRAVLDARGFRRAPAAAVDDERRGRECRVDPHRVEMLELADDADRARQRPATRAASAGAARRLEHVRHTGIGGRRRHVESRGSRDVDRARERQAMTGRRRANRRGAVHDGRAGGDAADIAALPAERARRGLGRAARPHERTVQRELSRGPPRPTRRCRSRRGADRPDTRRARGPVPPTSTANSSRSRSTQPVGPERSRGLRRPRSPATRSGAIGPGDDAVGPIESLAGGREVARGDRGLDDRARDGAGDAARAIERSGRSGRAPARAAPRTDPRHPRGRRSCRSVRRLRRSMASARTRAVPAAKRAVAAVDRHVPAVDDESERRLRQEAARP